MTPYTDEQVEEMVREAVEKTEKSFGGTFKRIKSENEELKRNYESATAAHEAGKKELEDRINSLETHLAESRHRISELAVRGEIERQLKTKGPMPEHFIDTAGIEYSDDPEVLSANVASALDRARKSIDSLLTDIGVPVPQAQKTPANPTNPPRRDTKTAQDLRNAASKEALKDMVRRGLLR